MALEFLPEEQQDKVHLCSTTRGGAIAAAVGLLLEVTLSRFWLKHGRRWQKQQLGKSVIRRQSSVAMNKDNRQRTTDKRNPTDCSQSFRITRPSSGSIRYDSNPISVPNQGAELNETPNLLVRRALTR